MNQKALNITELENNNCKTAAKTTVKNIVIPSYKSSANILQSKDIPKKLTAKTVTTSISFNRTY